MKHFSWLAFIIVLSSACTTHRHIAKANYEVIPDHETKVLKGTVSRSVIEGDTTFAWFKNNMQLGSVDPDALKIFKEKGDKFSLLVFGGTWCHDTQNLLPRLYRLADKSNYPGDRITLIMVDRKKTAPDDLHKKYSITNVPTFIVMKNGKEIGRVVEYGKTGNIEKELADIVASL